MYTLLEDRALANKINQYLSKKPSASRLQVIEMFNTTSYRLNMLEKENLIALIPNTTPLHLRRKKKKSKIPLTLKWFFDRYGHKTI